jgi:branched-chain amino acid transport system substrate-binding protein
MIAVRALLTAAVALAVAFVPCASNRLAAQTLATYELPAILALSGPIAFGGKGQQQTLQIVEDIVNRTGGIQRHPLKINYLDDQSNAQVAVQIVNGLMAKGSQVMLGPIFVASCSAVAPLIEKSGPVSFCFTPGFAPQRGGFVFTPATNSNDQIQAYLRYFRSQGWTKIGILTTTDATGQQFLRAFDFNLSKPEHKSLSVIITESMGVSDISAGAQLQRIKAARPDVIYFTGSGPPFGTMLRGLSDAGIELPISSSTANMTYGQMSQYKDILPKTVLFSGLRGMQAPRRVRFSTRSDCTSIRSRRPACGRTASPSSRGTPAGS